MLGLKPCPGRTLAVAILEPPIIIAAAMHLYPNQCGSSEWEWLRTHGALICVYYTWYERDKTYFRCLLAAFVWRSERDAPLPARLVGAARPSKVAIVATVVLRRHTHTQSFDDVARLQPLEFP